MVQKNLKRLLAYSSIGHIGYALAGVATGAPTLGTMYDSDGGSFQDDWLPGKCTISLPVGWVMNENDTLVIRGDSGNATTTLIGWEVIDDA